MNDLGLNKAVLIEVEVRGSFHRMVLEGMGQDGDLTGVVQGRFPCE